MKRNSIVASVSMQAQTLVKYQDLLDKARAVDDQGQTYARRLDRLADALLRAVRKTAGEVDEQEAREAFACSPLSPNSRALLQEALGSEAGSFAWAEYAAGQGHVPLGIQFLAQGVERVLHRGLFAPFRESWGGQEVSSPSREEFPRAVRKSHSLLKSFLGDGKPLSLAAVTQFMESLLAVEDPSRVPLFEGFLAFLHQRWGERAEVLCEFMLGLGLSPVPGAGGEPPWTLVSLRTATLDRPWDQDEAMVFDTGLYQAVREHLLGDSERPLFGFLSAAPGSEPVDPATPVVGDAGPEVPGGEAGPITPSPQDLVSRATMVSAGPVGSSPEGADPEGQERSRDIAAALEESSADWDGSSLSLGMDLEERTRPTVRPGPAAPEVSGKDGLEGTDLGSLFPEGFGETVVDTGDRPPSRGGGGLALPESPIPGYEIQEELGRGGMAVVYKAVQEKLGRTVALKVMSPELADNPDFIRRFEREARAMATLSHTNVVAIHDQGQWEGRFFIVMEFVPGYSLRQVLEEVGGKLPVDWVLKVMLQVCVALSFAHDQGMVHRDIKPENILIDEAGVAKLSDFGLASLHEEGTQNLTQTNTAMGTYHYMAPEQQLDAARADVRADIYSFGVMLYEVITGTLPLGAWQPAAKLVPEIDPRFDDLITRCLQPNRDDRPGSIEEVLVALRSVQLGLGEVPQLVEEATEGEDASQDQVAHEPVPEETYDDVFARLRREKEMEERALEELRKKQAEEDRDFLTGFENILKKRWKALLEYLGISSRAAMTGIAVGLVCLFVGIEYLFPPPDVSQGGPGGKGKTYAYRRNGKTVYLTEKELHEAFREEPVYKAEDPAGELYSNDVMGDTTSALRLDPLDQAAASARPGAETPEGAVAELVRLGEKGKAGADRISGEAGAGQGTGPGSGAASSSPGTRPGQTSGGPEGESGPEGAGGSPAKPIELDPRDKKAVLAALGSSDPRMVMAGLELETDGKIHYKNSFLEKVYDRSADPRVRRKVVDLLLAREGEEGKAARAQLVSMIDPEDLSSGYIMASMRRAGASFELEPMRKQAFLLKAALAREASAPSLEAIRTLGAVGGDEAEQLLLKLRSDRSAALSRMATAAWEFRVRLGLVPQKEALPPPPEVEDLEEATEALELEGAGGEPPPEAG